jgi:competence ComEA-like helix-hairpin-helix protein
VTERQNEGAGSGAEDRGAIRWRLEKLHRRTEEGMRELGARIMEMYHQGSVDPEAVREEAAKLDELERAAEELKDEMTRETGPRPDRAARKAQAAPPRPPPRPTPVVRPVLGAEDAPVADEPPSAPAEQATNGERDEQLKQAVDTARRQAEERATAEIMALEEDLERERERAAKSLEEVQRRVDEAARRRVEGAESKLAEEQTRLRNEAGERLDDEMRRLQEESDAKIQEALSKVVADTKACMEKQAERRLSEQQEALRAEAEERVRVTGETVRAETERDAQGQLDGLRKELEEVRASRDAEVQEAERRAEGAEAKATAADQASVDAEVGAKTAAADWLRGQTRAIEREAERAAKESVAAVRREAAQAKRDAEQRAERSIAEREHKLAAELEEAARALKDARHQLREAEDRAEAAERKLGEASDDDLRRAQEEREGRFRQIEQRIMSVTEKASGAQAHAASVGIEPPNLAEAERSKPKPRRSGPALDVNTATFEELRELGMSVTQATRVIAYRERQDGFDSVDDLERVPGIPKAFAAEIKDQLTA